MQISIAALLIAAGLLVGAAPGDLAEAEAVTGARPTAGAASTLTGDLRVITSPAVPADISVDGIVRDTWGLNWVELTAGPHEVCFGRVAGYTQPACETVEVLPGTAVATTGVYAPKGYLRVLTSPAVASTISVDGVARNDWGLWTEIETGSHQVCFGAVAGYVAPGCRDVVVGAGTTAITTGSFSPDLAAPGPAGPFGYLRATTDPPVNAVISVDGVPRNTWGLDWVKLPVGSREVCFGAAADLTAPSCSTVTIDTAAVTSVTGTYAARGFLRVVTVPALEGTITVDGVPANAFGMWTSKPPGSYDVCFGAVARYTAPSCQNDVIVSAGATTTVTGTYSGDCPTLPGLDRWVWTGADPVAPTDWERPNNWSADNATVGGGFARWPGQRLDPLRGDDFVCIPPDGVVTLSGNGVSANIVVLENRGLLTVGNGAKLELTGTRGEDRYTSHSHQLTMSSESVVFGSAQLVVTEDGALDLIRDADGGPRLSTRDAGSAGVGANPDDDPPPCVSATYDTPLAPGQLPLQITIDTGAELTVSGGGVNYWDHTSVTNLGTVTLADPSSYIAADHGTSFTNHGTFDIQDDGDYVQGCPRLGQPIGTFTNVGLLTKTGGSGQSVMDADYSLVSPGSAAIASGTLRIFEPSSAADPAPVIASVAGAGALATGGCAADPGTCGGEQTSTPDAQTAALRRPAGAPLTSVIIDLDPPTGGEPGTLGKTVALTAGAVGDPTNPMIFSITVDGATAGGRTTATMDVDHDGVLVPTCAPVPVPAPACVVRPAVPSVAGQPVTLEIRTTQNGRWRFL